MIGGICGGIAEYFNIDPSIVRIVAVLSVFIGGAGFFIYIAGLIIIPENPNVTPAHQAEASYSGNSTIIWGVILIIVSMFFLFNEFDFWDFHWHYFWPPFFRWKYFFPLLLILGGIFYLIYVFKKDENPEARTSGQKNEFRLGSRPLYRSVEKKMVAGVCAGIAQNLNIDVAFIRIGWVVLTIINVLVGIIAYLALAIILPLDQDHNNVHDAVSNQSSSSHPDDDQNQPNPKEEA